MAKMPANEKVDRSMAAFAWAETLDADGNPNYVGSEDEIVAAYILHLEGKKAKVSSHAPKPHAVLVRREAFEAALLGAGIESETVAKVLAIAKGGAVLETFSSTVSEAKRVRAGGAMFRAQKLSAAFCRPNVRVVQIEPVEQE